MNANDVLKMIDAGFTADEIRKMTASPESSSLSPQEQKDAAALMEQVNANAPADAMPQAEIPAETPAE